MHQSPVVFFCYRVKLVIKVLYGKIRGLTPAWYLTTLLALPFGIAMATTYRNLGRGLPVAEN